MNGAAARLRAFVERIEALHEDAAAISEDLKEVYGELKGEGFDAKAVRAIVKMRKEDPAVRAEFEAIVDLYKTALGIA